jgi:aerobic carbon-monoxide dehydrogenase medium subunit
VIPGAFELKQPTSLQEAIGFLAAGDEDTKLLAGGQSLIPLMRLRFALPTTLVDIGRLEGLSYIHEDGDSIAIGALTRHTEVEHSELLEKECALLSQTAAEVGDLQVRNRGTIGGSLAHCDPNGDLPTAVLALGGELVAEGPNGRRSIPAGEFFVGPLTNSLEPDEIVVEVRVPKLNGAGSAYEKFARRAQDWAIVGCAVIARNGDETVAWTGVGQKPTLAEGDWRSAAAGLSPPGDLSGSPDYKRELAVVLAERALERARS